MIAFIRDQYCALNAIEKSFLYKLLIRERAFHKFCSIHIDRIRMRKDDDLPNSSKADEKQKYSNIKKISEQCDTQISKLFKQKDKSYAPWVIYLLSRNLAGTENLKSPCADIDTRFFLRAMMSGKASSKTLKSLCEQTMRFVQAKESFSKTLTIENLETLNNFLLKKNTKTSQKTKVGIWSEQANVQQKLNDCLSYLNNQKASLMGRVIMSSHDFFQLKPFKQGNGRTWRCLAWHILSKRYGDLQSLLIISNITTIDPLGFDKARTFLNEGNLSEFIRYWQTALSWSADSFLFMLHVFEGGHITGGSLSDHIKNLLEFEYYLKAETRSYQNY